MKTDRDLLIEANELLRSAYSIAKRKGLTTNWEAFESQLKSILNEQHKRLYPTLKDIRLEKLNNIKTIKIS